MATDDPKSIGGLSLPYDKLRSRVFRWPNFFLAALPSFFHGQYNHGEVCSG